MFTQLLNYRLSLNECNVNKKIINMTTAAAREQISLLGTKNSFVLGIIIYIYVTATL